MPYRARANKSLLLFDTCLGYVRIVLTTSQNTNEAFIFTFLFYFSFLSNSF